MSIGSPKLARREQAIEAARRRLRRLEIEQHRIKAALARLEADYEDDVADWLSRKVRRRSPTGAGDFDVAGVYDPGSATPVAGIRTASAPTAPRISDAGPASVAVNFNPKQEFTATARDNKSKPTQRDAPPAPQIKLDGVGDTPDRPHGRKAYRAAASPLVCSFAIHAVALTLCLTFTVATIVQQNIPLFSSPADLDEASVEEFSTVEIPPTKFEDAELQNVVYDSPDFNVSDNRLSEPTHLGVGTQPLGDIGQLDALPSELGTLMAGAGSPGGGVPGGPPGEAVFFGARSKGDRFVFVVDNSSSMKGGRLDAAIAELLNTLNGLSPRQSFYVIFVSDQTYPMFFPDRSPDMVPATAPNKQRLAAWLPNAILASGKNRELINAMDMAAALRPHAVFLLWDGDMKYSDKVRLDVMTHLTRPNQWNLALLA
jgi:hypothetical protein